MPSISRAKGPRRWAARAAVAVRTWRKRVGPTAPRPTRRWPLSRRHSADSFRMGSAGSASPPRRSKLHDHSVFGGLVGNLRAARQHVVAHMREDETLGTDSAEMRLKDRQ